MTRGALEGLSVLEIRGSVAGSYCGKLLADQGAEVALVELEPSVIERVEDIQGIDGLGPTPAATPERRALALALDGAKQHGGSFSRQDLGEQIAAADVVIESSAPGPLRPVAGPSAVDHRGLVSVRISPFGPVGPYAQWQATDCIDYAVSGHLYLTGDPDREPLQGPMHQPAYAAGLHAAIGALAALESRRASGRGQVVDVSHHETMVALHQFTLLRYTHNGNVLGRMGNRYAGPGTPIGLYRCADGFISLTVPRDDQLERLLAVAGLLDLLAHPEVESTYDLMHHPTLLDEHLLPWLATQKAEELVDTLQAVRVPAAPVRNMAGLLTDPHIVARQGLVAASAESEAWVPRPPLRFSPLNVGPAAAPSAAVDRGFDLPHPDRPFGGPAGPLDGLRILDLTRVWAGPLATRILADLGAEVIMVEAPWARGPAGIDQSSVEATHYYPDDEPGEQHWNRIGFFNKYGVNKRSLALDLAMPEGREVFEQLVGWADVVIENYSPRVMPQLGLGEHRLAELNPHVVYVTMPGFGRTGPAVDWVAYGPMIDSHAGLSVLQGYRNEAARKGGVAWPDPVAGLHAAFGVLAALSARRAESFPGQVLELAQLEATLAMVGDALAAYQLSGTEPARRGNRHELFAPQGVYRTSGDDAWLALCVVDEAGWAALVSIARLDPSWSGWDRVRRHEHHDLIDDGLSAWCSGLEAAEVAGRLQALGIAAAPVAKASDVMADPQLEAAGFFVELDHAEAGRHSWPRLAARLSTTPATYRRPAPLLGQHNAEVLLDLCGLSIERLAELRARGVIADRPPP